MKTTGLKKLIITSCCALMLATFVPMIGTTNVQAKTISVKKNVTKAIKYKEGKKVTLKLKGSKKTTFKSNKKSVASVNKKGVVTLKKIGKTKITLKNKKNKKKVNCTIVSYGIKRNNLILGKGVKSKIVALDKYGKKKFTYKSSNSKVATVSKKGVITAKNVGSANVKVYYKYKKGKKTKKVLLGTIKVRVEATSQGIKKTSMTVSTEATQTINAWDKYGNDSASGKLKFVSSNKNLVSVTNKGVVSKVRGSENGNATVTVYSSKNQKIGDVSVKTEDFSITYTRADGTRGVVGRLQNETYLYQYNLIVRNSSNAIKAYFGDMFKDVSGYYTCELTSPDNFTYTIATDEDYGYVPSFKESCGNIKITGSDIIDYDYDSEYSHQNTYEDYYNALSFKIASDSGKELLNAVKKGKVETGALTNSYISSNGTIYGGAKPGWAAVDLCKVKVGDKYFIIEMFFNRTATEKGDKLRGENTLNDEGYVKFPKWYYPGTNPSDTGVDYYGFGITLCPTVYQLKAHDAIFGVPNDTFLNKVRTEEKFKDVAFNDIDYNNDWEWEELGEELPAMPGLKSGYWKGDTFYRPFYKDETLLTAREFYEKGIRSHSNDYKLY